MAGNCGLPGPGGPGQAWHRRETVRGDAGTLQDVRQRSRRSPLPQGV